MIMFIGIIDMNLTEGAAAPRGAMAEHEEVYDDARADRLAEMLRALAERIRELDRAASCSAEFPSCSG